MILPISIPEIKCYNHHAFPTAILGATTKDRNWLYNNYMTLKYEKNVRRSIDFEGDYFLESENMFVKGYYTIPSNCSPSQIIHCLEELIHSGYYIVGKYDEYYIPKMSAYGRYAREHNYLLYGFDKKCKVFFSSGYTERRIWEDYYISYENFIKSILNENGYINFNNFAINLTNKETALSVKRIRDGMANYCEVFLSGEEPVECYLFEIEKKMKNKEEILPPSFYALYEHKKIFFERFERLENIYGVFGCEKEEYKIVTNEYDKMLKLLLKYSINNKANVFESIMKIYKACYLIENRVFRSSIDKLDEIIEATKF